MVEECVCFIFFFVIIFFVLAVIVNFRFFQIRCPKCDRFFAGEKIRVKTLHKGGWLSGERWLETYECRLCKHVWEEEKTADLDYLD